MDKIDFIGPIRKRGQRSFKSILLRLNEYSKEAPSGCIEWQKRRNSCGYGTISYRNKSWLAHRLKWTLENGAIPEGMNVCHSCDNPACINIEHLFIGTQADNVSDMVNKGRGCSPGNPGEKHHNAILSADDVAYIRNELANRKHGKDGTNGRLARKFGVSEAAISNINKDRRWKNGE